MLLIPAIDLKEGRCVRLRQGRPDEVTVFGDDPVAVARHWLELGAQRLHLVDIDGAFAGRPVQTDIISAIIAACPGIPVQIGGGIRDVRAIETCLELGAAAVIIGTLAAREPDFTLSVCSRYSNRIMIGLDARNGRIATAGWADNSDIDVLDLARQFDCSDVAGLIYTDISRDGMLTGINIAATRRMAATVSVPVVASGGLRNAEELHSLKDAANGSIYGVIAGRSIYEGTIDFGTAVKIAAA